MTLHERSATWRVEPSERGVVTVWFDTPDRGINMLDAAAFDLLGRILDDLERDRAVEGMILRSAKESGFGTGLDPAVILGLDAQSLRGLIERGTAVFDRLERFPKPNVAILHGDCLGAGLDLALACRHRVALASSATLRLAANEVLLGLVPPFGLIDRLARLIEPRDLVNLLLSGRSIGFLMAKSLGIVDRLASIENVDEVHEIEGIEGRPPVSAKPEEWESAVADAKATLEGEPALHQEAKTKLLELISLFRSQGPGVAREAAAEAFVGLAGRAETRQALEAAVQEGRA